MMLRKEGDGDIVFVVVSGGGIRCKVLWSVGETARDVRRV